MGALFAGTECVIESYRAKHDGRNSIYAGCATGAILAHSGGPKAMCIGCASFAAFSAAIDSYICSYAFASQPSFAASLCFPSLPALGTHCACFQAVLPAWPARCPMLNAH